MTPVQLGVFLSVTVKIVRCKPSISVEGNINTGKYGEILEDSVIQSA